jgi:hypothetical protein
MDGEFLDYFQSGEGLKIPSMVEFSEVCRKMYKKEQYDFVALSLRALDDDSFMYEWSNDILSAVWSKSCLQSIAEDKPLNTGDVSV